MDPIMVIKLFDVRDITFMGPFMSCYGMKYILVAVDYVSKWVEAIGLPNNESKSVTLFLKINIFSRFQTPIMEVTIFSISCLNFAYSCPHISLRHLNLASYLLNTLYVKKWFLLNTKRLCGKKCISRP